MTWVAMSVRRGAASALGRIGPPASIEAIPALINALGDTSRTRYSSRDGKNLTTQLAACGALKNMGDSASPALEAAKDHHESPEIRSIAAALLEEIREHRADRIR